MLTDSFFPASSQSGNYRGMITAGTGTPSLLQNRWLAQWPGQDELAEDYSLRRSDLLRDGVGGELSAGVFCPTVRRRPHRGAHFAATTDVLGIQATKS